VADAMALYGFPSLQQQASPEWLGGGASGAAAKALAQQASFLKDQGRLTSVAPDYSKNVSVEWVTRAMK
jgi:taurine transport system substrate-binding protein